MNNLTLGFLQALCIVMLAANFDACARDLSSPPEALPGLLYDPLLTTPPEVYIGKNLPGDIYRVQCPSVYASTGQLNLEMAIDLSLCRNPKIKYSWAAIKMQAAALGEARAAYFPTFTGSLSRLNDQTNYPNPADGLSPTYVRGTMVYGNLIWRIFDFGGRNANRRSANYLLDAALASHDAVIQRALVNVVEKYFEAQTALALWRAKQQSAAFAKKTLLVSERREVHGIGSGVDTLQARTAYAKATLESNRTYGSYQKLISELANIVGLNPGVNLILADSMEGQDTVSQKDLADWLNLVQQQHPSIMAARKQLESAREKKAVALSEGLPSIDFTANFFQNGRPNQGLTLVRTQETLAGFTLNLPIFDGFAKAYKLRGAEADVEQKKAELQEVENQISMEVVKAYADASSALKNIEASKLLFDTAQLSLKASAKKYDEGVIDILGILNAQAAMADAEQEYIRTKAELRSAKLRLYASAGIMGRTLVSGKNY